MKVIIFFFTHGASTIATLFAVVLVCLLLEDACTPDRGYETEIYSLHAGTESLDSSARSVEYVKDKDGTVYAEALVFDYTCSDSYALHGEYKGLSGVIFVPENRPEHDFESLQVSIYGDGKRLYLSEPIQYDTAPVSFSINISGVQELTFKYNGSSWRRPTGIGNLTLSKEPAAGPTPEDLPMRLLDLPTESKITCRYTDLVQNDTSGHRYLDSMVYGYDGSDTYQLSSDYSTLKGTIFIPDDRIGTADRAGKDLYRITIICDGEVRYISPQLLDDSPAVNFSIDVQNVDELKITYVSTEYGGRCDVGLADLLLYD